MRKFILDKLPRPLALSSVGRPSMEDTCAVQAREFFLLKAGRIDVMDIDQIMGRIVVIEYVLTQSFAIALNNCQDPHKVLDGCAEHFALSMQKADLSADQARFAKESSERIFTSLRSSISGERGITT